MTTPEAPGPSTETMPLRLARTSWLPAVGKKVMSIAPRPFSTVAPMTSPRRGKARSAVGDSIVNIADDAVPGFPALSVQPPAAKFTV